MAAAFFCRNLCQYLDKIKKWNTIYSVRNNCSHKLLTLPVLKMSARADAGTSFIIYISDSLIGFEAVVFFFDIFHNFFGQKLNCKYYIDEAFEFIYIDTGGRADIVCLPAN